MSRLKLTAGGPQYVSEFIRYPCPNCKKSFLIHPSRWSVHLSECLKDVTLDELTFFRENELNAETKNILEKTMLYHHNSRMQ